jgi:hypothetical protein
MERVFSTIFSSLYDDLNDLWFVDQMYKINWVEIALSTPPIHQRWFGRIMYIGLVVQKSS